MTSVEPQTVNLLVERFPCYRDAAANDELGREIGLYIYYGTGDRDGIPEHEDVVPGPDSLAFCVGYLNYMSRLDAANPDTHPAGSMLMDDFGSAVPTPIDRDAAAVSDYYRIVEANTMTTSTVSSRDAKDGGTSYSGRDSFETVVEMFKAAYYS